MIYKLLSSEYDAALASLIRTNLKAHHLDIPGTVYFDEGLDHLSTFYADPRRAYYVLLQDEKLVGGIGLAEFEGLSDCCELQKLYLDDTGIVMLMKAQLYNQSIAETDNSKRHGL